MKILNICLVAAITMLSTLTYAKTPLLEANSLIVCAQGSTLNDAVDELNVTVSSNEITHLDKVGNYVHIKNFNSSTPVITNLGNGNFAVCVTLVKKGYFLKN